jgi:molybdate transport system substrate-binding protein
MIAAYRNSLSQAARCAFALCAGLSLSSCRPSGEPPEPLTIYAAASLTEVVAQLGTAFDPQGRYNIRYNFASSGVLASQLIASPQADLFLSANPQWVDALVRAGRVNAHAARPFLSNRLCLIAHPSAAFTVQTPQALGALNFQHLALGDPAYVPAGSYAQQWLQSIDSPSHPSLWLQLEHKLLPSSDVRAVIGAVAASAKVIGIVYQTDYMAAQTRVQRLYSLPADTGPAIHYLAAPLNQRTLTRDFLDFLHSPPARAIFVSYGFVPSTP